MLAYRHFHFRSSSLRYRPSKLVACLLALLALATAKAGFSDQLSNQPKPLQQITTKVTTPPLPIDSQRDHIKGKIDAEFSLIEYSDFDCPFCRRFHPTAKRLIKDSGGNINWVYRHFPLVGHKPGAQQLAEAAECVAELGGNTAFWRFTDAIIMQPKRGQKIMQENPGILPESVKKAARVARIDVNSLADCLDSGRHAARVLSDENNALQMGLLGTPANVIVNNKTGVWFVRQGAASLEALKADIAKLSRK